MKKQIYVISFCIIILVLGIQILHAEDIKNNPVTLKVYNLLGKSIETIINKYLPPGIYELKFNGDKYSSGIYYYCLIIDNITKDTKAMVLLK